MKDTVPLPGIFDAPPTLHKNRLIYGDNLTIMRTMPNACVDLIYLDPPFNSRRNYNLIYKKLTGQPVPEQEEAFCDAWEMDPEKEEMARRMPLVLREYGVDEDLVLFWKAWIDALRHTQPRLLAYLIYMSYRLFEMKRVLKPTSSLYLHCDPTASHYIKIILDGVFGHQNFRNEIVWHYETGGRAPHAYSKKHQIILFYTKGDKWTFNRDDIAMRRGDKLGHHMKKNIDSDGKTYWSIKSGGKTYRYYEDDYMTPEDTWLDISHMQQKDPQRLGYPTQKPLPLLKRIILASSNEGDVVFDPFCGCGTSIYAAHLLNRKWIGCDIAILSVRIVRDVLLKRYGLEEDRDYEISGIPLSVEGAQDLFDRDPRQFQHWAVELAGGFSSTKTTGDRGIDGRIHFEIKEGLRNMVLSVKGGKLSPTFMRELRGTMEREQPDTQMGGLICLQQPTKGMKEEEAIAGRYTFLGTDYDRLQIRTIQELLDGKGFDTPSRVQTLGQKSQIAMPI